MKAVRYIAITILVSGLIVFSGSKLRSPKAKVSGKSFTLTSATLVTENNRASLLESIVVKFVRSPGRWKQLTTYAKTQNVEIVVARGGNIYRVTKEKQEWLSEAPEESEEQARSIDSYPELVRTEALFGLTAYVTHHQVDAQTWGEFWYARETGDIPLKIHTSRQDGKSQRIVEPISLTFGDIPDSVLESADLPISFERIKQELASAESQGHVEFVQRMRPIIEQAESKIRKQ